MLNLINKIARLMLQITNIGPADFFWHLAQPVKFKLRVITIEPGGF